MDIEKLQDKKKHGKKSSKKSSKKEKNVTKRKNVKVKVFVLRTMMNDAIKIKNVVNVFQFASLEIYQFDQINVLRLI